MRGVDFHGRQKGEFPVLADVRPGNGEEAVALPDGEKVRCGVQRAVGLGGQGRVCDGAVYVCVNVGVVVSVTVGVGVSNVPVLV